MPLRVLVADDDPRLRAMLRRSLGFAGFDVDEANDGPSALAAALSSRHDLIVLDLTMPGMDGLEVCRRLREQSSVPILILTARGELDDRVAGLRGGADDYLAKPFALDELTARLHALARRSGADVGDTLTVGELELDLLGREAHRSGRPLALTPLELTLLEALMRRPNQVVTRQSLWEHGWGVDQTGQSNALAVALSNLRQKLGPPSPIATVRGLGYRLREP